MEKTRPPGIMNLQNGATDCHGERCGAKLPVEGRTNEVETSLVCEASGKNGKQKKNIHIPLLLVCLPFFFCSALLLCLFLVWCCLGVFCFVFLRRLALLSCGLFCFALL